MRRKHMKSSNLIPKAMLAFLAILLVGNVYAAKQATSAKASKATEAQTSLREVEYESLENRIGSGLVIETTNDTTRRGTLERYTKVSLSVKLGPDSGSIELAVPRTTIRKVMLEIAPADPLFLEQKTLDKGKSGAKKN